MKLGSFTGDAKARIDETQWDGRGQGKKRAPIERERVPQAQPLRLFLSSGFH
jgi:hypothetical protein